MILKQILLRKKIKRFNENSFNFLNKKIMIELQYFNGTEWTVVSTWNKEWMAWVSLGGDDHNYRTVDENGKILTDKSEDKDLND